MSIVVNNQGSDGGGKVNGSMRCYRWSIACKNSLFFLQVVKNSC